MIGNDLDVVHFVYPKYLVERDVDGALDVVKHIA